MADVKPFRAVRPARILAGQVAALPYDVYSREEAAAEVAGKPLSFLNIDRPETMFDPAHDMYADDVYAAARERYDSQKASGIYVRDREPYYYIYELTMDGRSQTGIVAVSSVEDYLAGICKKHENTVEAKERDRIRHVDAMSAQTGPIFLSYHASTGINGIVSDWKSSHEPENEFISPDGIGHRTWVIDSQETIGALAALFRQVPCTYIADGHHRAASAVRVGLMRRQAAAASGSTDPEAPYNYFLSVLFPDSELKIFDYNRVVMDLNGLSTDEFLKLLGKCYDIRITGGCICASGSGFADTAEKAIRPGKKYETGMYLAGRCYMLSLKKELAEKRAGDPVKRLDVSVLQDEVLSGLLGIMDPRTDPRIRFVGGIRGLHELIKNADEYTAASEADGSLSEKGPAVAFAMYPTSMEELFAVADAGLLMPPKSTWFEPKLRSGLFIHEI